MAIKQSTFLENLPDHDNKQKISTNIEQSNTNKKSDDIQIKNDNTKKEQNEVNTNINSSKKHNLNIQEIYNQKEKLNSQLNINSEQQNKQSNNINVFGKHSNKSLLSVLSEYQKNRKNTKPLFITNSVQQKQNQIVDKINNQQNKTNQPININIPQKHKNNKFINTNTQEQNKNESIINTNIETQNKKEQQIQNNNKQLNKNEQTIEANQESQKKKDIKISPIVELSKSLLEITFKKDAEKFLKNVVINKFTQYKDFIKINPVSTNKKELYTLPNFENNITKNVQPIDNIVSTTYKDNINLNIQINNTKKEDSNNTIQVIDNNFSPTTEYKYEDVNQLNINDNFFGYDFGNILRIKDSSSINIETSSTIDKANDNYEIDLIAKQIIDVNGDNIIFHPDPNFQLITSSSNTEYQFSSQNNDLHINKIKLSDYLNNPPLQTIIDNNFNPLNGYTYQNVNQLNINDSFFGYDFGNVLRKKDITNINIETSATFDKADSNYEISLFQPNSNTIDNFIFNPDISLQQIRTLNDSIYQFSTKDLKLHNNKFIINPANSSSIQTIIDNNFNPLNGYTYQNVNQLNINDSFFGYGFGNVLTKKDNDIDVTADINNNLTINDLKKEADDQTFYYNKSNIEYILNYTNLNDLSITNKNYSSFDKTVPDIPDSLYYNIGNLLSIETLLSGIVNIGSQIGRLWQPDRNVLDTSFLDYEQLIISENLAKTQLTNLVNIIFPSDPGIIGVINNIVLKLFNSLDTNFAVTKYSFNNPFANLARRNYNILPINIAYKSLLNNTIINPSSTNILNKIFDRRKSSIKDFYNKIRTDFDAPKYLFDDSHLNVDESLIVKKPKFVSGKQEFNNLISIKVPVYTNNLTDFINTYNTKRKNKKKGF